MKQLYFLKKSVIWVIFALICEQTVFGQVRYSQEVGTLEDQTMIDEYNYIFMTKEPTQTLKKVGITTGGSFGKGFLAAYEHKIFDNTSINAEAFLYDFGLGLSIEPRYYYNMASRIKKKQQANNLTGGYIAVRLEQPFHFQKPDLNTYEKLPHTKKRTYALIYGFQTRINDNAFADLGFVAGMQKVQEAYCLGAVNKQLSFDELSPLTRNWFLTSTVKLGLAWADRSKRATQKQYCDFLRCFEEDHSMFKLNLQRLFYVDRYDQSLFVDADYEQKIGKLPFSINIGANLSVNRQKFIESEYIYANENPLFKNDIGFFQQFIANISTDLRWYFQQKHHIAKGASANNLSGNYVKLYLARRLSQTKNHPTFSNFFQENRTFRFGVGAGYQTKFSKRGFLDVGVHGGLQKYDYGTKYKPFADLYLKLGITR